MAFYYRSEWAGAGIGAEGALEDRPGRQTMVVSAPVIEVCRSPK
jgi:hypothetical protein